MLICGVDEAGRGPVIGPMVFGAVVIDKRDESELTRLGVTDSKLLLRDKREELFDKIKDLAVEYKILSVSAAQITEWMKTASLNDVEAIKTAEMINSLTHKPDLCYVDCPDVIPSRYSKSIKNLCEKDTHIIAEHKADMNYKVAGAASILAKVTRDRAIDELAKVHGEIGSGYMIDVVTRRWVDECWEKNKRFPDCVRKRWSTVTSRAQLKITEW